MPKTLVGHYNASRYQIDDTNGKRHYEAGNSPLESQGYIAADKGVGLDTMKHYCASTLAEMCAETGAKNGGVSEMEDDDCEDMEIFNLEDWHQ